jgi:hypothetical protein
VVDFELHFLEPAGDVGLAGRGAHVDAPAFGVVDGGGGKAVFGFEGPGFGADYEGAGDACVLGWESGLEGEGPMRDGMNV